MASTQSVSSDGHQCRQGTHQQSAIRLHCQRLSKECMQISYTIHVCSQIVWLKHRQSFFQPSVSDAHSKACNGRKTHAFSTGKSGNGAGSSRMRSACFLNKAVCSNALATRVTHLHRQGKVRHKSRQPKSGPFTSLLASSIADSFTPRDLRIYSHAVYSRAALPL